jgi:hypothetical protein
MGKDRVYRGELAQYEEPEWGPLLDAVGEEVVGDFMWMSEIELDDGRRVQAYKHRDTRRYIHLDEDGEAFVYESRGRYRSVPAADVLTAVFVVLPGLWGVTDEQIARSWAAVERLEDIRS